MKARYIILTESEEAAMHIASETGGSLDRTPRGHVVVLEGLQLPAQEDFEAWRHHFDEDITLEVPEVHLRVVTYRDTHNEYYLQRISVAEAASLYLTTYEISELYRKGEV